MNVKGFRRMLLGEKMPDKNDPQYRERYERDVDAGRKFAKAVGIDKAAAKVQLFANNHKNLFLIIIFKYVIKLNVRIINASRISFIEIFF